jgi:uncharacterized protein
MPVAVSYPGVYIQEIPSGVHTISGVSTSLTAFVGRAYRGPVNTPIRISSFGDFQRFFGGLTFDFPLSYAVRDFFQNGGSEGVVVRLYGSWGSDYTTAQATQDAAEAATAVAGAVPTTGTVGTGDGDIARTTVMDDVTGAADPFKLNGAAPNTEAGVQYAAAQAAVAQVQDQLDGGETDLARISASALAAATGPSGASVLAAVPPVMPPATVTVTGATGLEAVGAANDVLNATGNAAVAEGATAATAAAEAMAEALNYAKASPAAKAAANAVAQAAQDAAKQASPTPASVVNAAAAAAAAALTGGNTRDIPAFPAAMSTAIANAQKVVTAAWGAAVESGATAEKVATAATGAETAQDPTSEQVGAAATQAAAVTAPAATPASVAEATGDAVLDAVSGSAVPTLVLRAASQGDWPNGVLTVTADSNAITAQVAAAVNPAFAVGDLFNLTVGYRAPDGTSQSERFLNVALRPDAGPVRLDRVLANGSNFIRFPYPDGTPPEVPFSGATGTAAAGIPSADLQDLDYLGDQAAKTGMYALEGFDLFNLMVIPMDKRLEDAPSVPGYDVFEQAAVYCQQRRAFLLVEPPAAWSAEWATGEVTNIQMTDVGNYGPEGRNAAVYFPRVIEQDPLMGSQPQMFSASGAIAGIMARTDAARGVWKAPAGVNDGAISGIQQLELKMTDADNGVLNPLGINCLRTFPVFGSVVWGSRTLKGADQLADDYKYVPVRRLTLYIEESLYRGTQWAVFEPNAEPLWASIRLSIGSFMNQLFRQGAFAGASAKDAYFVACDATTTTQADIDAGVVNVTVGFAPLKPAEFVVISIQQIAGQLAT